MVQMRQKDQRIKLLNEILNGIKVCGFLNLNFIHVHILLEIINYL